MESPWWLIPAYTFWCDSMSLQWLDLLTAASLKTILAQPDTSTERPPAVAAIFGMLELLGDLAMPKNDRFFEDEYSMKNKVPFRGKSFQVCWYPLFCAFFSHYDLIWFERFWVRPFMLNPSFYTMDLSPRLALFWNSAIAYGERPSMKQGEMDGQKEVGPLMRPEMFIEVISGFTLLVLWSWHVTCKRFLNLLGGFLFLGLGVECN